LACLSPRPMVDDGGGGRDSVHGLTVVEAVPVDSTLCGSTADSVAFPTGDPFYWEPALDEAQAWKATDDADNEFIIQFGIGDVPADLLMVNELIDVSYETIGYTDGGARGYLAVETQERLVALVNYGAFPELPSVPDFSIEPDV